MKIYIPVEKDDPHFLDNPFISTYTDSISSMHKDVAFYYNKDLIWQEEAYSFNVVHFMWPQLYCDDMASGKDLRQRLAQLKSRGVRIFATCHNFTPHVVTNRYSIETYNIVYSMSDVITHLGEYSLNILKDEFPESKHYLIPHHVYDDLYNQRNTSIQDSINELKYLSSDYRYVLSLGTFRSFEEKKFFVSLASSLFQEGIRFIAPSFLRKPYGSRNPKWWLQYLWCWIMSKRCHIVSSGKYVSDEQMPAYFDKADIVFVQRLKILNSGNVPLGLYMGKVVVGPNVGNVGSLLALCSNPTFDPDRFETAKDAIMSALEIANTDIGEKNRAFCIENWSTKRIAEMYYKIYTI